MTSEFPTPVETIAPYLDPFGGTSENWSLPGDEWPPVDEAELAALDAWTDACEREVAERYGHDFGPAAQ